MLTENIFYFQKETDIGSVYISADENYIKEISLRHRNHNNQIKKETEIIAAAFSQLSEYFKGSRKDFDLPLNPNGTQFQKSVWKELQNIPYGHTRSYSDIAKAIGNPNASRAVGGANNKNPIFIVIPCHRVIGKNGSLVGYGGGLD